MECAVPEEECNDDAAQPKGRAARPSGFGVLDRDIDRKVVSDGTLPGVAYLYRPTALPAIDKVCGIEGFDLTSPEIRATARLRGGRLRFPLSVSDFVLQTAQVVLAESAFRTGIPSLTLCADDPAVLEKSTASAGADQIVTPRIQHGPPRNFSDQTDPGLVERGTTLSEWPRDWDCTTWPNATAEFSKSDQDILRILEKAQTA
jgi:hypothetical protein